jgi:hypothetical protein
MTIEAGVVIDLKGAPLFWHLPEQRTGGSLPDSRQLWDVLWDNRENLLGFAHSHPGSGMPGPSWTDVTTFSAVEKALDKRLEWWIASSDRLIVVRWSGPGDYDYAGFVIQDEPAWVVELRAHSLMYQAARTDQKEVTPS